MSKQISIDSTLIGNGLPAYIVAEIGLNHNKDMKMIRELIDSAKKNGANAVKFQAYKTEKLIIENSEVFSLFKGLELSKEEFKEISDYCREVGITFFATPFCLETVDMLEELNVPCYKVASMDINYYELLQHIGMKRKPVLLSTGMSSIGEIEKAVNAIKNTGNEEIIIFHCISHYPPKYSEMNLKMIEKLKTLFPESPIGLSDHSLDNSMSMISRALGAEIFERHFTLDRKAEGPDHQISLEPHELLDLREKVTIVDESLTIPAIRGDLNIAKGARRSLFAAQDLEVGTILTKEMFNVVRPGNGIAPEYLPIFLGRKLSKPLKRGDKFDLSCF